MSPLETIFIVGVAVATISIGMLILDDLFEGLERRRRHDDFAAILRELTVSAVSGPARRSARTNRRYRSHLQPFAAGRARHVRQPRR